MILLVASLASGQVTVEAGGAVVGHSSARHVGGGIGVQLGGAYRRDRLGVELQALSLFGAGPSVQLVGGAFYAWEPRGAWRPTLGLQLGALVGALRLVDTDHLSVSPVAWSLTAGGALIGARNERIEVELGRLTLGVPLGAGVRWPVFGARFVTFRVWL